MVRTVKDPLERKNEIMDVAEELFISKGFETISINEIIKQVGIAKGTFYYYFPSKESLLDTILERHLVNITSQCEDILREKKLKAVDKLKLVLKSIFMPGSRRQGLSINMESEKNILMKVKLNNLFFEKFEPILTSIVEQGIEEGIFDTQYPKDITQVLLRGIQSYINIHFSSFSNMQVFSEKMKVVQFTLERILGVKDLNFINI